MAKPRYELCASTLYGRQGIVEPDALVRRAISIGLNGLALMDSNSTQAFPKAEKEWKQIQKEEEISDFRLLYGCTLDTASIQEPLTRWSALAANRNGLANLYTLLTLALDNGGFRKDARLLNIAAAHPEIISTDTLFQYRHGLLLSLSTDELYRYAKEHTKLSIRHHIEKTDYITVMPYAASKWSSIVSAEEWHKTVLKILDAADDAKIPVCAVSCSYYTSTEEQKALAVRGAIMTEDGEESTEEHPLLDAQHMLQNFDWLNDSSRAEKIVFDNPAAIAEKIENFSLFEEGFQGPDLDDAEKRLAAACRDNAKEIFGQHIPPWVGVRLAEELRLIHANGFDSVYCLNMVIAAEAKDAESLVFCTNCAGASLVNYLIGITDVNPLPPYHYCPNCRKAIPLSELPAEKGRETLCPDCGSIMKTDGYGIDYTMLMGIHGDRIPCISFEHDADSVAGIQYCISSEAGVTSSYNIGQVEEQGMFSAVEMMEYYRAAYPEQSNKIGGDMGLLVNALANDKFRTVKGPYRAISPRHLPLTSITPIQPLADGARYSNIVTHYEFCDLRDHVECYTEKENKALTELREMEMFSQKPLAYIPLDDPKVFQLFALPFVIQKRGGAISAEPDPLIGIDVPHNGNFHLFAGIVPPQSISDLASVFGLCRESDEAVKKAKKLLQKRGSYKDIICSIDDLLDKLLAGGMSRDDALDVVDTFVEQGSVPVSLPSGFDYGIGKLTRSPNLEYRADTVHEAISAYYEAWYKIHYPACFYAAKLEGIHRNFASRVDYKLSKEEIISKINAASKEISDMEGEPEEAPDRLGRAPEFSPAVEEDRINMFGNNDDFDYSILENADEVVADDLTENEIRHNVLLLETDRFIHWLVLDAEARGVSFRERAVYDAAIADPISFDVDRKNPAEVQVSILKDSSETDHLHID
jgi:DNA polymerase-3 subunit alpha (Gram-positive type)